MGVNNLPNVTTQRYLAEARTRDLMIANPKLYRVSYHASARAMWILYMPVLPPSRSYFMEQMASPTAEAYGVLLVH